MWHLQISTHADMARLDEFSPNDVAMAMFAEPQEQSSKKEHEWMEGETAREKREIVWLVRKEETRTALTRLF